MVSWLLFEHTIALDVENTLFLVDEEEENNIKLKTPTVKLTIFFTKLGFKVTFEVNQLEKKASKS